MYLESTEEERFIKFFEIDILKSLTHVMLVDGRRNIKDTIKTRDPNSRPSLMLATLYPYAIQY
jgi:hypothetical protein